MPGSIGIAVLRAYDENRLRQHKNPLHGWGVVKNSQRNTVNRLVEQGLMYKDEGGYNISGLGRVTLEAYELINGYIADHQLKNPKPLKKAK